MSFLGKISRGSKWWSMNRDANGDLLPIISDDTHMMIDVNAFLNHRTTKEGRAKLINQLVAIENLGKAVRGKKTKRYVEMRKEALAKEKKEEPKPKSKEKK